MEPRLTGIRQGFLKKYGGFVFKQWKEKYVILTVEGSLAVCKDADSPPDQVVALQSNFWSVVDGREIMDLPRLPPGGRRDCCFALIFPQDKFLLLLSDNPQDCSQWLTLLRKVKEGLSAPLSLKRQHRFFPCFTDRCLLPVPPSDKQPLTSDLSDENVSSPHAQRRQSSVRSRGNLPQHSGHRPSATFAHPSQDCLRHGNSSDVRAVRTLCLLMGGTAASSTLGYLSSCSSSSSSSGVATRAPDVSRSTAFSELGGGASLSSCSQGGDSPHFNSFDFEGDSDFDAFDCGGFAF
ncbi:uncharacterized protein LOC143482913 [Brachyhypopomus gauderio]|uniref:uncharacterized protein LOC143482913 n=1 Tax=Brachyhypopomus gauderio TaxID=698409 RepID=UPI004041EEC0